MIKEYDQKFFRVICRDVGHDFRTCTERRCSLLVTVNTLRNEAYICRHVPSDGPENIKMHMTLKNNK